MGLKLNVVKKPYFFRVRNKLNQETSIRCVQAESKEAARLQIEENYEILHERGGDNDDERIEWGDEEG